MKYASAALAGAVASASAQQSYSTIYEYYSDCGLTSTGSPITATGTSTFSLPSILTGVTYNPDVTETTTEAITICPTCTEKPAVGGKTVEVTTYTTVYSCPGPSGLEEKTYTITEPCPTPGVPFPPNHIPQGFTATTVRCTACPGQPNVVVTTPIAEKTAAPAPPGSGSGSSPPAAPAHGSSAESSPGALGSSPGSSSPGAPGSGAGSSPGAPGSSPELSSPGAPGSGSGSSSPGAPGSGSSSPGAPGSGSGSSSPGSGSGSGSGSSSPGSGSGSGSSSPGSGSGSSPAGSPAGGPASPPYPRPAGSEARGGSAPSGSAAPSGSVAPVTPFKGSAPNMVAISLSFVAGVAAFAGFYLI